jgi:hypothetical protein
MVTLTYANGGKTEIALDEYAVRSLMASCHATEPAELEGASWTYVRDALAASSNRYRN